MKLLFQPFLLVSLAFRASLAQPVGSDSTTVTEIASESSNQTLSSLYGISPQRPLSNDQPNELDMFAPARSSFPSSVTEITVSAIRNSTQIWTQAGSNSEDLPTRPITAEPTLTALSTRYVSASLISATTTDTPSSTITSSPSASGTSLFSVDTLSSTNSSNSFSESSTSFANSTTSSFSTLVPAVTELLSTSSITESSLSTLGFLNDPATPSASIAAIGAKVNSATTSASMGDWIELLEVGAFTVAVMIIGF